MQETRDAAAVHWPEDSDGAYLFACVGSEINVPSREPGKAARVTVTRITVTQDLPGMHCNMERVRVYAGDDVVMEAPAHAVEAIQYHAPEGAGDG